MYNTLFYIIVAVIVVDYILERYLAYLNSTSWSDKLPEELEGVYDAQEYKRSQDYKRENDKFSFITSSFSFIVILLMLYIHGFALVDNWAREFSSHPILVALVFFGIMMFASDIINTPFALYDTFVIEEKYGFNKTTVRTFISDKIKGWLLTAIIGGGLLALIIWLYTLTTTMFWIYAWIAVSAFMVFMTMFYSTLIVPLFNKQTPLPDGELRTAITDFCKKAGFQLDNVFVIDGSKRSTKANAYFSGLGAKKRIVLFDTLTNDLGTDEIVAVLAHEIGHYKKKHTLTGIGLSVLQTGLTFFILSLFIQNPALSEALGTNTHSFHIALITFGILYSPISMILGLGLNILSRKNEYEADRFADSYDYGEHIIAALKKLTAKNLSNLTPHPAYVFVHYSHPTLLQRIRALRGTNKVR